MQRKSPLIFAHSVPDGSAITTLVSFTELPDAGASVAGWANAPPQVNTSTDAMRAAFAARCLIMIEPPSAGIIPNAT
jgi:hypothetical protein